jgi:hypothetical protein
MPPRTPSRISDSLHQRLNSYALAASAAGVASVAFGARAQAKVIYRPAHIIVQEYETYKLDFNHDGVTDLSLKVNFFSHTSAAQAVVSAAPAARNGIEGRSHINFYAAALSKGASIGPKQKFGGQARGALMASVDESIYGSFQYGGNWVNVNHRYLGAKFHIGGKTHYGWVRANVWVTGQGPGAGAILTGYAYETVPNQPIVAGKTHGPEVITLQPVTLGHLARGASAIPAWRRKEQ